MKASLFGAALLALGAFATPSLAVPIAAPGTEGYSVFATGGNVTATYHGSTAAYNSLLFLNDTFIFDNKKDPLWATMDLGSFTAGQELVFRLYVINTDSSYFTGSPDRNADGFAHARVESDWMDNMTLVSFEDLYGGPFDYNDLSFSFTNTMGADKMSAIPLPAGAPLLIAALGGFAVMRRRKKN
ncbi:VPLPA-CTERM sorting domain-containing protein [Palleronia sp. LCG004]|uniref:VPLPA-CTERM sorting domain-containing protein n=1 Tax=Palleronia sp. LCG004 TaxID=3079304 RepID=UPI002942DE15|nr:VPLPA-CTERM sorting domain-containing protein [Palleronia sp. LCG004]WOI56959.1 VPLPA-CTERM sorting domain-containing protein [Palleronia sp. LCG004]